MGTPDEKKAYIFTDDHQQEQTPLGMFDAGIRMSTENPT